MAEKALFEVFAKTIQSAKVQIGANFDKLDRKLDRFNRRLDTILKNLGINIDAEVNLPSNDTFTVKTPILVEETLLEKATTNGEDS